MNFWILLPLSLLVVLPAVIATATCPDGFKLTSNQQKCLRIFTSRQTHMDASTQCTSYGGTLANIRNAIDNRAIASFAANSGLTNFWIGVFCYLKQEIACFHDDSTGVVTYNSFANGYPKENFSFGQCVYMKTAGTSAGQWETNGCQNETLPFVCEVPVTIADPTCKYNYGGNCYLPSQDIPNASPSATFDTAQGICTSQNSNLVSIHSKREVDYIKSIYKNYPSPHIIIGAQAVPARPHVFKWVDAHGWEYNYRNPFDNATENCMQMELVEGDTDGKVLYGTWTETSCQTVNNFLCKRRIIGSFDVKAPEQKEVPITLNLDDPSHCNNTLLIAPGVVTSLGYGSSPLPEAYCTYNLAAIGAYRVAIHFTDFSIGSRLEVLNQYGSSVAEIPGDSPPFSVIVGSSMAVINNKVADGKRWHGFNAVIMPY